MQILGCRAAHSMWAVSDPKPCCWLGFRCLRYPRKPTAVWRRHPPSGTVPWFMIPELMDNYECSRVDDVKAMTNSCLFKVGTSESWYVQGGLRFFIKFFVNYQGAVEVRVSESSTSEVDIGLKIGCVLLKFRSWSRICIANL